MSHNVNLPIEPLTVTQYRVILCACFGLRQRETAEEMGITVKTVKAHCSAILGVYRRAYGIESMHGVALHFLGHKVGPEALRAYIAEHGDGLRNHRSATLRAASAR